MKLCLSIFTAGMAIGACAPHCLAAAVNGPADVASTAVLTQAEVAGSQVPDDLYIQAVRDYAGRTSKPMVAVVPNRKEKVALLDSGVPSSVRSPDVDDALAHQLVKFGMRAAQRNGVTLLASNSPEWMSTESDSLDDGIGLPNIERLLRSLSPAQQSHFLETGEIRVESLSPEQKDIVLREIALLEDVTGRSNQVRPGILRTFTESGARVRMTFQPRVFYYPNEHAQAVGRLSFQVNQPPSFGRISENVPYVGQPGDWLQLPYLIEPPVDIPADLRDNKVRFAPGGQPVSLRSAIRTIAAAGGMTIEVSASLPDVGLIIMRKDEWRLIDVLKAVCIVTGSDLRKVGQIYFVGPSKAYELIYKSAGQVRRRQVAAASIARSLLPRWNNQKVLLTSIYPLRISNFLSTDPVSPDTLTDSERKFLLDQVPPGIDRTIGLVRFVLSTRLSLVNAAGAEVSYAKFSLIQGNAESSPKKPIESRWTPYPPDEILRDFNAVVINR